MGKMNSPFFIFHAAKEYFENGTLYASKYFKVKKNEVVKSFDSMIHPKLCVPATNISFSLELAFKALLLQSGIKKTGHNLIELYKLLDNGIKDKIIQHYKSHDTYKNYIAIRLIESSGEEHGKIEAFKYPNNDENFILSMLETHKLSFLNFRYMYEFESSSEWIFYFREFSNFTFSVLTVLGQTLNLTIVSNKVSDEDLKK
jgi:hypothetical protein